MSAFNPDAKLHEAANRTEDFHEKRTGSNSIPKAKAAILDGLVERTGTDDMSAVRELACILCLPT